MDLCIAYGLNYSTSKKNNVKCVHAINLRVHETSLRVHTINLRVQVVLFRGQLVHLS